MMSNKMTTDEALKKKAWRKHNLESFQYFRSLDIRTKLSAIEGMADTARRLQELRQKRKDHDRS